MPHFKACARTPVALSSGFVLYYTSGCPFTEKYVALVEQYAAEKDIPFTKVKIEKLEEAQNAPTAWTNYALFYNGTYITNEILSVKKFSALCETLI